MAAHMFSLITALFPALFPLNPPPFLANFLISFSLSLSPLSLYLSEQEMASPTLSFLFFLIALIAPKAISSSPSATLAQDPEIVVKDVER